jgi:hypothetical protein
MKRIMSTIYRRYEYLVAGVNYVMARPHLLLLYGAGVMLIAILAELLKG